MGIVYAIANQKGGVGKTTTAVNVAACIAEAGYETLLVDVDPQGNATVGVGADRHERPGLYDVLSGEADVRDAVRTTAVTRLALLASTADLAGATMELPRLPGSETRLREALAPVRSAYAYTLLDCPPSLGPLTVNALVAADRVIVPVQTEYFALEGLAGLLDTLGLIQRELNPRLTVAGMLLTMHDARTKLAQDVEAEVRRHFPSLVFDTVIPRNIRLGEAPSFGRPVIHHDPGCAGSDAYFELAKEVAARGCAHPRHGPRPSGHPDDPADRRSARFPRSSPRRDRPESEPAAADVRRGLARRTRDLGTRARRPATGARTAAARRDVRADRRGASVARGAIGGDRERARVGASRRRRGFARTRTDREHGSRGSRSARGGTRVCRARRGARAVSRGRRPARRPLSRCDFESHTSARRRVALRGPWQGAAHGAGSRHASATRAGGGLQVLVGPRNRGTRPRGLRRPRRRKRLPAHTAGRPPRSGRGCRAARRGVRTRAWSRCPRHPRGSRLPRSARVRIA